MTVSARSRARAPPPPPACPRRQRWPPTHTPTHLHGPEVATAAVHRDRLNRRERVAREHRGAGGQVRDLHHHAIMPSRAPGGGEGMSARAPRATATHTRARGRQRGVAHLVLVGDERIEHARLADVPGRPIPQHARTVNARPNARAPPSGRRCCTRGARARHPPRGRTLGVRGPRESARSCARCPSHGRAGCGRTRRPQRLLRSAC